LISFATSPIYLFRLINPTTAKSLGHITVASEKDIDLAVEAAQKAFDTTWGLHASGQERGKLLIRLAELIEENIDELAALESLDNGERICSHHQRFILVYLSRL
jgi:aldehyde dehydrogenase (NAD+)